MGSIGLRLRQRHAIPFRNSTLLPLTEVRSSAVPVVADPAVEHLTCVRRLCSLKPCLFFQQAHRCRLPRSHSGSRSGSAGTTGTEKCVKRALAVFAENAAPPVNIGGMIPSCPLLFDN